MTQAHGWGSTPQAPTQEGLPFPGDSSAPAHVFGSLPCSGATFLKSFSHAAWIVCKSHHNGAHIWWHLPLGLADFQHLPVNHRTNCDIGQKLRLITHYRCFLTFSSGQSKCYVLLASLDIHIYVALTMTDAWPEGKDVLRICSSAGMRLWNADIFLEQEHWWLYVWWVIIFSLCGILDEMFSKSAVMGNTTILPRISIKERVVVVGVERRVFPKNGKGGLDHFGSIPR